MGQFAVVVCFAIALLSNPLSTTQPLAARGNEMRPSVALDPSSAKSLTTAGHSIGDTVTLHGTVYAEDFYGPPNYGEDPQHDARETAYILKLAKPLQSIRSDGKRIEAKEVQVIAPDGRRIEIGKPVTFRGELDEAISGHHRRDVLLVCDDMRGNNGRDTGNLTEQDFHVRLDSLRLRIGPARRQSLGVRTRSRLASASPRPPARVDRSRCSIRPQSRVPALKLPWTVLAIRNRCGRCTRRV